MKTWVSLLCGLLFAAGTIAPALAQEWTDLAPTTIDGLKYATACTQHSAGRSPFKIKLVNTTDAELSGWYSYTIAGTESPHKPFDIKAHAFMAMQSLTTLGCSTGITVTVGQ